MKRVFISSVIGEFEEFRSAAKEAAGLMGFNPVMSEELGARSYSPEEACITEVENSDVYILLLGGRFGYEADDGISVTQQEFRAAQCKGIPVLAFIHNTEMEPKQKKFIEEVEDFKTGFFRANFATPEDLMKEIIKGLRQLDHVYTAASEEEFFGLISERSQLGNSYAFSNRAILRLVFWPQPPEKPDLDNIHKNVEDLFISLAKNRLIPMKDGYNEIIEKDHVGLEGKDFIHVTFEDGMKLFLLNPTEPDASGSFGHMFVSPSRVTSLCQGVYQTLGLNGAWCFLGLDGMNYSVFGEPPPSGTSQVSLGGFNQKDADFRQLLIPINKESYMQWIQNCTGTLRRIYKT